MQRNDVIGKKENFQVFNSPYMIDIFDKTEVQVKLKFRSNFKWSRIHETNADKKIPSLQQPWN